ncbi:PAP2 superfamily C-terminal-domain-containing protein [Zychaea mexicana]|uniref:PAP2 superfamily C-terminal-domain-containing protein n=1 Tax=Zychaea mexicana TaxID=64656 RepID=UPI0022FEEA64|nr:PAP2 superfamily C-terminal-domain-containing protein [Zychaea mexicana]KAI9493870.1 PAP2 superfamily C-terminal-domain-containing protein [Zychaea mexicana]
MIQYLLRSSAKGRQPPASIARWDSTWQRIGFIKLRLEPPGRIRTWHDVLYIFYNHDFLRLALSVIWLIVCGLIESFLAQLSEIRYSHFPYDKVRHSDLMHDAFPRVENYLTVNYLLLTTLLYTTLGFALQSPDWTTRIVVLRRWLVIMGAIYIFRGICVAVTTLPSSRVNNCVPSDIALNGSAGARFSFLFRQIGGQLSPCTDNIFSGHTSAMMSCVMVWRIHTRVRRIFSWIAYLIVLAALLMILFTRFHYTVDVLLAVYITYSAWYMYMDTILEASKRTMFAFRGHSTRSLFRSRLASFDADTTYEFLTWQPTPLMPTWVMWLCMYADGLDIRLRALGIMDEHGRLTYEAEQHMHSPSPPMVDIHEMTSQSLPT